MNRGNHWKEGQELIARFRIGNWEVRLFWPITWLGQHDYYWPEVTVLLRWPLQIQHHEVFEADDETPF